MNKRKLIILRYYLKYYTELKELSWAILHAVEAKYHYYYEIETGRLYLTTDYLGKDNKSLGVSIELTNKNYNYTKTRILNLTGFLCGDNYSNWDSSTSTSTRGKSLSIPIG